jgi:hypothetical protein
MAEEKNEAGQSGQDSDGKPYHSRSITWMQFFSDNILNIGLSIGLFVFLVFLGVSFKQNIPAIGVLLDKLKHPDYARGVITFVVVIFAVSAGLILIIYALNKSKDDPNDPRFQRAREVYSVFGSLLATIVGFYYGSSTKNEEPLTLTVEKPVAITENNKTIERLYMDANGGKPPYRFVVRLEGDSQDYSEESTQGFWKYDAPLDELQPKDLDKNGKISIDITAIDANNNKANFSTEIILPPKPAPSK